MTGIITAPIVANPEIEAQGIEAVPSGTWEGSDPFSVTRSLGRWMERADQWSQTVAPGAAIGARAGVAARPAAPPPMLTSQQANDKFGIDGHLTFDDYKNGVPEGVARNLYRAKLDELTLQDVSRRAPAGIWNGAKRLGANFIANALDPLNVAASFIPVVGEARYAEWLANAGSALGRAGVRAGVGAAAGVVGQVPLEAIRYGLANQEQADWSSTNALLDLAYGGVLGGVLHAGGGAFVDALTGRYRTGVPLPATTGRPLPPADPTVADIVTQAAISLGHSPEDAAAYGKLYGEHYAARGERLGVPAAQLFEQEHVTFRQGEPGAEGELFQAGTPEQEIPSAGTSVRQIPRSFRVINFPEGGTNLDIGGGRFDEGTEFLKGRGVENLIYDPFNRDAAHNDAVMARVRDNPPQTVTVNNVLNVIREEAAREGVIHQAAETMAPDGKAYFLVYEGDKSGQGRVTKTAADGTPESWQNNKKADEYVAEIRRHFGRVERRGNIIGASAPIRDGRTLFQSATQTPEFKSWFGDSKVVDEKGEPLTVYHGTASDVSEFDPSRASRSSLHGTAYLGHWFSTSPEVAGEFVPDYVDYQTWPIQRKPRAGGNIIPVHLSIKNPKTLSVDEFRVLVGEGRAAGAAERFREMQRDLVKQGYDGIHVPGDARYQDALSGTEFGHDAWVAFRPEQIKSVFNRGTFDPNDPHILSQQGAAGPRGSIRLEPTQRIITLFKGSDASTLLHETGHLWLGELMRDAAHPNATPQMKADAQTALDWLGAKSVDEITTEQHEKFARGFEAYLREGKAPTPQLEAVFAKFKAWLTAIYKSLTELNVEVSPEVRSVFDRMVASDRNLSEAVGMLPTSVKEPAFRTALAQAASDRPVQVGPLLTAAGSTDVVPPAELEQALRNAARPPQLTPAEQAVSQAAEAATRETPVGRAGAGASPEVAEAERLLAQTMDEATRTPFTPEGKAAFDAEVAAADANVAAADGIARAYEAAMSCAAVKD